jgi:hypothetical protein
MVVFYRCSCTRKCYKSKALEGLNAARDLYNSISPANKPGGSDQGSGELGALTLAAGVYKSASGTKLQMVI